MWNFFQGGADPNGAKKQQSIGTKSFYWNTFYGFEYKKTAKVSCL